ncbi:RNA polymerase subunit sigma [Actinoalloteichus sp. AHMU CJ021]|uniref:RNA polymerase sigma factor n=1 Tax=Actinoalloteichus caeruleus DSM 43889 TaxID=1120930 RepID=A0ABT1JMP2_ACTCY|nr:sigma-70 family RNA polymerase sigma factor [Actinoalloteichus caeruleus]AUS79661.1 RNA polymerase subunit sigma [Actinoalloteichus sp. AHMU CJ021]MCP2333800.1 RNA polymerase sigma-70 factor, ECF subfamily [Actinoalloteichus caeruleus DSM 43889]
MTWRGVFDDETTRLAVAAGTGDREAIAAFVRATQRDVWRFTAHLTTVDSADDLTQETYLRALRALPSFEGRSSARAWLLSIARRAVVDQLRYAGRRPTVVGGQDWERSAEAAHSRVRRTSGGFEGAVELDLLLDELEPERREVLVLTQVLGLSYQEAAEVCGCPVGTVRSRVARARDDLMRALDGARSGTG